jgi:hypothetical protein
MAERESRIAPQIRYPNVPRQATKLPEPPPSTSAAAPAPACSARIQNTADSLDLRLLPKHSIQLADLDNVSRVAARNHRLSWTEETESEEIDSCICRLFVQLMDGPLSSICWLGLNMKNNDWALQREACPESLGAK